jgi:hypothetical protein
LAPGVEPSGPLFDPLFEPLPSQRAGERGLVSDGPPPPGATSSDLRPRRPAPTDVIPGGARTRNVRRDAQTRRAATTARPRAGTRRIRRTVKRIDPWSVLKMSLFLYSIFLVLWLVLVAVLYSIIDGMGLFDAIESFGQGFALDWGEVDISLMFVERWAFFIGIMLVIAGSLINGFLAFLYNVGSDLVGGLEMTFSERDA